MPTILVVDDDAHILEVVQYALEREGFNVITAQNGAAGLSLVSSSVDLVILDILMPELDGLEVCRRLRSTNKTPIIFLSSKSEEVDRIVGLELGGDDYLVKPFSPRELVARVRAVLRRTRPEAPRSSHNRILVVGPARLDPVRHEVTCQDQTIPLTVTEFSILHTLFRRPGQVMTRSVIVQEIYTINHQMTERTIDTHIRRIRHKFKATGYDPIETIHGLGYKAREK